jgi:sulfate/thiosulfate transport system permease protein
MGNRGQTTISMSFSSKERATARNGGLSPIPGFGLTLGYTLAYLSLLVLIPLAGVFIKAAGLGFDGLWQALSSPRVLAALKLSFGTALAAAALNMVFGFLVAWVFVRYEFPGKRLFDAMIDLPFALPTAVAGIALTALYAGNGWVGQVLEPQGLKIAFAPAGIVVALTFIGLPFVVRTVEPVLREAEKELEEAAASLGATRWQTVLRVILPAVLPALITGFALAFARGVGEYGSVIFIAGNIPQVSEIAPLLIVIKLEEFDYAGATAIAAAMLVLSFALLLLINTLQARVRGRGSRVAAAPDTAHPMLQGRLG